MKFVKIPGKDFEMSAYQCTQKEWKVIMGSNSSHFKGESLPVETVSFNDVQEFINKLNEKQDRYIYRLPTEEDWEFCCRAGSTTDFCFGDSKEELKEYAWFLYNSECKTHPVGEKKPNDFGLYDMHGNVWEWCDSFYFKNETDPSSYRALRGGAWGSNAQDVRCSGRNFTRAGSRSYFVGFRLARTARNHESLLPSNNSDMSLDEIKKRMWKAYQTKAKRDFLKMWKEVQT